MIDLDPNANPLEEDGNDDKKNVTEVKKDEINRGEFDDSAPSSDEFNELLDFGQAFPEDLLFQDEKEIESYRKSLEVPREKRREPGFLEILQDEGTNFEYDDSYNYDNCDNSEYEANSEIEEEEYPFYEEYEELETTNIFDLFGDEAEEIEKLKRAYEFNSSDEVPFPRNANIIDESLIADLVEQPEIKLTKEDLDDLDLPPELRELFEAEIDIIEEQAEQNKQVPTTALSTFGTDITALARNGELPVAVGREKELAQIYEILARRQKNNPVLIGEAGVGKTAVIELFAQKIADNQVPFLFLDRKIISLDLAAIIAGTRYHGEFEERFKEIIQEAFARPEVILFFDEIHMLVGAGGGNGAMDASNLLKPMLARGGFQCMGATTLQEYSAIEKDPALHRRFQTIKVSEPSIDETMQIIYGLRNTLETYHNVTFGPGAIQLAVELSARHIQDRFLPDKAIDFLDRAAARQVVKATSAIEGDVLSKFIKTNLIRISQLKNEAYRRGDIATEYVFQEVINTYENFFLTWIQDPLSMKPLEDYLLEMSSSEDKVESSFTTEEKRSLSPLSAELMTYMHTAVAARASELLFASSKIPVLRQKESRHLSSEENDRRYYEILSEILSPNRALSDNDLSLVVYMTWLRRVNLYNTLHSNPLKDQNANSVKKQFRTFGLHKELWHSFDRGLARPDEKIFGFSQKDEVKFKVMYDLFRVLRPLVRQALIQSLAESAEIKFTPTELQCVYSLLGLSASTKEGRAFVSSKLKEPSALLEERESRDFTLRKGKVTAENIRELMAELTGIPMQSLSAEESKKLLNLEATLHERVMGQDEAVVAIAKAIRRSRLGIQNPNRPLASFLFCGPTGVGKTEVTKAIATALFGSEKEMVRFDMSEFMEKFAVSRLIGAPPGYVGYEEGGQLTNAVRKKPYCVILFDEVEKASAEILNILLQILDDGRLTDSQKRLVLFDNTVIIMTSNVGAAEIQDTIKAAHDKYPELREEFPVAEEENLPEKEEATLEIEKSGEDFGVEVKEGYAGAIHFLKGSRRKDFFVGLREEMQKEFQKSMKSFHETKEKRFVLPAEEESPKAKAEAKLRETLKEAVNAKLGERFLPEFINRLDDIIVFQPLKKEELRKICDVLIAEIAKRLLKQKNVKLAVSMQVRAKLTREAYSPEFGARPLRRLLTKYVEDLVSDTLLHTSTSGVGEDTRLINIVLDKRGNYIASTDITTL